MSGVEHKHHPRSDEPALHLVVIGMSAGGLSALKVLLQALSAPCPAAIVVAQHAAEGPPILAELISRWTAHHAVYAESGQRLEAGVVYVCPVQTHLIVNPDATLTVSRKPRVRFVRPSIDWLFESAAAVYQERALAVILSGANADGARGASSIVDAGGTVIVQDPRTCMYPAMPVSAIRTGLVGAWLPPQQIATMLMRCLARGEHWTNAWTNPFADSSDAERDFDAAGDPNTHPSA